MRDLLNFKLPTSHSLLLNYRTAWRYYTSENKNAGEFMRQIKVRKKSDLRKSSGNAWVTFPEAKAQYKRVSAIGYY